MQCPELSDLGAARPLPAISPENGRKCVRCARPKRDGLTVERGGGGARNVVLVQRGRGQGLSLVYDKDGPEIFAEMKM